MKRIIYLCATLIISVNLIGCSNTFDQGSSLKSSTEQQENLMQLKETDIQEIQLDRTKNHTVSKAETDNTEMIASIITSIQNGTPKEITLDQKTKESIYSNMTVTFKDYSKEEFWVWLENKDQIIIAKSTDKNSTQGIIIDNDTSKLVVDFFKK